MFADIRALAFHHVSVPCMLPSAPKGSQSLRHSAHRHRDPYDCLYIWETKNAEDKKNALCINLLDLHLLWTGMANYPPPFRFNLCTASDGSHLGNCSGSFPLPNRPIPSSPRHLAWFPTQIYLPSCSRDIIAKGLIIDNIGLL